MYQYQQSQRYFAQVAGGTEALAKAEFAELGATEIEAAYRGLHFTADRATLYRLTYQTRLATRLLAPLISFDCHSDKYLYKTLRDLDWTDFLSVDSTFAVAANVAHSRITHSKFAALRVKDAVVDQFRERTGRRPSIDTRTPDLWLNLYLMNNRAVVSVDVAGGSLHRRGYRLDAVEAPIQETVAAAMIRLSGWDGERPLLDPMCGAGTLVAEALMHYCRIPAAYLRRQFGFAQLPDFDRATWQQVKQAADEAIRPLPDGLLQASDRDPAAVKAAQQNLRRLPQGEQVQVQTADLFNLPPQHDKTLLTNPPYGLRIGPKDMPDFYRALGDFLKQKCTGSTAFIYFGKREYLKRIGLRAAWKKPLVNGALDGRLARFDLY